ncbi:hypothetical protein TTHERM_00787260 (macronuclear) [Tetrahymena thermophila SB210]|uniref:Uncharacterized protein n=1 Tax=Tetrahymena thermophila (strain SB210) TaxID=312017 RepID=Q23ZD7_TETTS|nr:hypothetical protein TTHERM_00787260 [Tetrahymena thermophila SB210]EAS01920.1 hypothetical protein TTHERM_00787260 [Tetrahymena thermophila SB210]|eukprot:XP_001022165.1 hypothetical protein TTHERM_00787260 [Tetrahymena thermophila SB210]
MELFDYWNLLLLRVMISRRLQDMVNTFKSCLYLAQEFGCMSMYNRAYFEIQKELTKDK